MKVDMYTLFETCAKSIKQVISGLTIEVLIAYSRNNLYESINIYKCLVKEDTQMNLIQNCFHKYQYVALALPWVSYICLLVSICILLYNTHNIQEILQIHKTNSNSNTNDELKMNLISKTKNAIIVPDKVATPKTQLGRALKMQSAFNALPKADMVNISTPMTSNTIQSTAYSAITLSPRLLSPLGSMSSQSPDDRVLYPLNENSPLDSKNKNAIR